MSDENSQTAIQEKVAQLTESLSIVQNDRAALRAQIAGSLSLLGFLKDELDGKNVAASSGADAEGALLSNASLLEQNIARLQAEIVTSRQVHSQMAQQISELLAGLHASGKSQSVKEVLHRIDDLNSCYATLFDLHSHLRSQTKPTAQGVASALNHLKTLETETAQLQGQREELAGQVAEASAAGSSQISKAVELARAPLDAEHAKQIAEINARITQQAAKRDSLLKEVDTLRAEANLWASRLSALSTAKAESAAMAANLKEELDRVKAQHQEEIAALNAQLTASTFPLSSYLATVQPIRSAIGESKAKHDAEARAIAATNKNVAYLQHQIKTIKETPVVAAAPAPASAVSAPVPTPTVPVPTPTAPTPAAAPVEPVKPASSSAPAKQAAAAAPKGKQPKRAVAAPKPEAPKATVAVYSPGSQAPAPRPVQSPVEEEGDGFKLVTKKIVQERAEISISEVERLDDPRLARIRALQIDEDDSNALSEPDQASSEGSQPAQSAPPPLKLKSTKPKKPTGAVSKPSSNPIKPEKQPRPANSSIALPSAITDLFKPLNLSGGSKKSRNFPLLPPGVRSSSAKSRSSIWQHSTSIIAVIAIAAFLFWYFN